MDNLNQLLLEDELENMLENLVSEEQKLSGNGQHSFSIFVSSYFDINELADEIARYNPDIICFQHLNYDSLTSLLQLDFIRQHYYYSANVNTDNREVIFSKFPVVIMESFPFHISSCNAYINVADLAFPVNQFPPDGDSITLINVSFDRSDAMRQNQFSELLKTFTEQENVFVCASTRHLDSTYIPDVWSEINSNGEQSHKAIYYNSRYYYSVSNEESHNGEWIYCKFSK